MAYDLKYEDLIVTFVLCVVQVAGNFVFLHSAWKQHVPCHLHGFLLKWQPETKVQGQYTNENKWNTVTYACVISPYSLSSDPINGVL